MSVQKIIHTPLSDADIHKILGKDQKLIIYSDLSNYSSLHELLPGDKDSVVILYEQKQLSGHWTCLLKYDDKYEFFDPYGIKSDSELKWVTLKQRSNLHEDTTFLSKLLNNEEYIYNKVDFQQNDSSVETCGSHVSCRLHYFKEHDMNLEQYQDFMKRLSKELHQPYDYIVTDFVSQKLSIQ